MSAPSSNLRKMVPGDPTRHAILHFHLFKNAGTTIDAALARSLGQRWTELEASDPNEALAGATIAQCLESDSELRAISSHTARFPAPALKGVTFHPVVILRHPLDRILSIYHHERDQSPRSDRTAEAAQQRDLAGFIDFLLQERPELARDGQTSWLARNGDYYAPPTAVDLRRAEEHLARLPVPGIVEQLDRFRVLFEEMHRALFPELDLAAPSQNSTTGRAPSLLARLRKFRAALGPERWQRLRAANALDLALWKTARRIVRDRWAALPGAQNRLESFRRRIAERTEDLVHAQRNPAEELPWTGERLVPSLKSDLAAEHLHRYALAIAWSRGLDVLDVACGEGYGSALLSAVARSVVGIDADVGTVEHARRKYARDNLSFETAPAEKLPLADASVDLVVSFETIEHLADHSAMLREIKRVLRPSGRLLLSTPDRDVYRADHGGNPFHVRELNFRELSQLVRAHFRHARFARQRLSAGSLIVEEAGLVTDWREFSGDYDSIHVRTRPAAPYFLVLASDDHVPGFGASAFDRRLEIEQALAVTREELRATQVAYQQLDREFQERTAWAEQSNAEYARARDALAQRDRELAERTAWAETANADSVRAREALAARDAELAERTKWALDSQHELKQAARELRRMQDEIGRIEAESRRVQEAFTAATRLADERTAWAESTRDELHRARELLALHQSEIAERTAWAVDLGRQIAAGTEERERLHAELIRTQKAHADQVRLTQERESLAQALSAELRHANHRQHETTQQVETQRAELAAARGESTTLRAELAQAGREIESGTAIARALEAMAREKKARVAQLALGQELQASQLARLQRTLLGSRQQLELGLTSLATIESALREAGRAKSAADAGAARLAAENATLRARLAVFESSWWCRKLAGPVATSIQCPTTPAPAAALRFDHDLDGGTPVRLERGWLELNGWARVDAGRIDAVRLVVAGNQFDCEYGLPRSDVGGAFPNRPDAARSGFRVAAWMPPGLHGAELQCLARGEWHTLRRFIFDSALAPLVVQLESTLEGATAAEPFAVHGWCFHPQYRIEKLEVRFLDGRAVADHGLNRDDVRQAHGSLPSAATSGFRALLRVEPGTGPLILVAQLADGTLLDSELSPRVVVAEASAGPSRDARARRIRLPVVERPKVSIVIPIYNQIDLTLRCLETLAEHATRTSFEVIVVDDASPDPATCVLAGVPELRLLRNATNLGFIDGCNRGAREAHGEYVLFLNNDTEVSAGWMDALLDVFVQHPNAGAAGAMLVYPDGSLQEAGALVWSDGNAWNYGRGDDPRRPEYQYLRQADFCSGACLLVPRTLFFEAGGFDTRYRPAYYEDVDLAFTLRAAGRPLYFQPAARILHREGSSAGTDTRGGMKKHQVLNRERFRAKWADVLARHNLDASTAEVARDRHAGARVLVIDACALTPDMDAGSVRMFNLLRILARRGLKVTFAAENLQFHEPYSTRLQQEGIEHLGVPHVFNLAAWLESNAYAFEVIIISRKHIASQFVNLLRRCAPAAKLVFDTVDLMFVRLARQAAIENSEELRRAARESREQELELCRQCDRTFVVSEDERTTLSADIPAEKIDVVPLIHDVRRSPTPYATRNGILFVGGFQHPPNLDAVEFFLDAVLPIVHRALPTLEVHIVGSNTPARLRERATPLVQIHGYVSDLDPLLDRVRLSIAPLRYGAGVKGKVNQSMSHGVPVVATHIATEGMHLTHGVDVLVGDSPEEFAAALVRGYTDEKLWHSLVEGGIRNIEDHFSFATVERAVLRVLEAMAPEPERPRLSLPSRPAAAYALGDALSFGHTGAAARYLDGGWSEPTESFRWAVGRKAQLRFQIDPATPPSRVECTLFPLLIPGRVPEQNVRIVLPSGAEPATVKLTASEPTTVKFTLPPGAVVDGLLTLQFHFPETFSPASLGLSADVRSLSVAFLQLTIL